MPTPGLADDRHDLPVAVAGELLGAAELLQLGVAADEARQPARGGRLEPRPRRARPRQLVDLDGVGQPLHRHGAERLHLDVALGQLQRRRASGRCCPGSASCSIRAARCVVWPTAV